MLVRRRYKSQNSICRGDTPPLIFWVLPQTNHRPAYTKFRDFNNGSSKRLCSIDAIALTSSTRSQKERTSFTALKVRGWPKNTNREEIWSQSARNKCPKGDTRHPSDRVETRTEEKERKDYVVKWQWRPGDMPKCQKWIGEKNGKRNGKRNEILRGSRYKTCTVLKDAGAR